MTLHNTTYGQAGIAFDVRIELTSLTVSRIM
jgi:hypothetical protein